MFTRRTAFALALIALCAGGVLPPGAAAQQVVRMESSAESLGRRMASAVQQASRNGASAVVGYGIVVRAPANEIWGMYSLEGSPKRTLSELLGGPRMDSSAPVGDDRIIERRTAVLIRVDADGRPDDITMHTLDSIAHFDVDTIYWLGDASTTDSFDLLLGFLDDDNPVDLRRGAVYSLSRHGLAERAHPVLTGLVRNRSEPDELRKAAVYGLGMLGTDAARRTLLDLIYEETS